MNETIIRLKGKGFYIQVTNNPDEDAIYEFPFITEGLELYQYIGDKSFEELSDIDYKTDDLEWVNITKKKGKYLKGKFIREQIEFNEINLSISPSFEYDVHFLIQHEGEFNPKLIHLMRSDYEFTGIPYGIFADVLKYDNDTRLVWEDDLAYYKYNTSYELEWNELNQMWM